MITNQQVSANGERKTKDEAKEEEKNQQVASDNEIKATTSTQVNIPKLHMMAAISKSGLYDTHDQ